MDCARTKRSNIPLPIFKVILFTLGFFTSTTSALANAARFELEPPPSAQSEAYINDFRTLHELQDHRTQADCDVAESQSSLNLKNTFGPATGILTKKEMKQAQWLATRVIVRTALAVAKFKTKFKRPRPFKTDSTLIPCIHKPSDYAYPSGHSATGYALALALSKKFPHKRELIMDQGIKIGENRLIGGVHHPSDVEAGRKLAIQVIKKMRIRQHKQTETYSDLQ